MAGGGHWRLREVTGGRALAPAHLRDPAKPRFDRSLTRPVPQLVGARRLRTLLLSDVDYLKGADARSPTAVTPDATARHHPLRLPVMGLPPRYTVANHPLRPTFSNLDSALCTHVPPNMPPAYPPSHLAPRCAAGVRGDLVLFVGPNASSLLDNQPGLVSDVLSGPRQCCLS